MALFSKKKPAEVESSPRVQKDTKKSLPAKHGANQTSWVKGKSGNPAGRPPNALCVTHLLREIADDIDPVTNETRAHALARSMWEYVEAREAGWRDLAIYLINRVDGVPKQQIEMSGNMTPTEIVVQFLDSKNDE